MPQPGSQRSEGVGSQVTDPPEIRHDLTVTGPVQLIIEFWGAAS